VIAYFYKINLHNLKLERLSLNRSWKYQAKLVLINRKQKNSGVLKYLMKS
jgi:hypothetical protein